MIYKEKVLNLLEKLDSKLRVLHFVANGQVKLSADDVVSVIEDCKKVREQISEFISIER